MRARPRPASRGCGLRRREARWGGGRCSLVRGVEKHLPAPGQVVVDTPEKRAPPGRAFERAKSSRGCEEEQGPCTACLGGRGGGRDDPEGDEIGADGRTVEERRQGPNG